MTRECDIGRVAVVVRGREHVRPIDGGSLRLVDGRGIAVIEVTVEASIDRDGIVGGIEPHLKHAVLQALDRSERAVLDAERALVAQEIQAIADREFFRPELGLNHLGAAELAVLQPPGSRERVELAHIGARVREYQTAALGRLLAVGRPTGQQRRARGLAVRRLHHGPLTLVSRERKRRVASGELQSRVPLPPLRLASHFSELGDAALGEDAAEGSAGLDGLELLGVADQDNFRFRLVRYLEHPGELPCADHAGLIDHEHIASRELFALARPGVLEARKGAGVDPGGELEILRGDA